MCLRFDPFCDHMQAQRVAHGNDGLRDRGVIGDGSNVVDEGAVDLELFQRQALEVGQRGKAGAEVVNRKTDAQRLQLLHAQDGFRHVVDHHAFGQLDLEATRVGAGLVQHLFQIVDKAFVVELADADVDRQVQIAGGGVL